MSSVRSTRTRFRQFQTPCSGLTPTVRLISGLAVQAMEQHRKRRLQLYNLPDGMLALGARAVTQYRSRRATLPRSSSTRSRTSIIEGEADRSRGIVDPSISICVSVAIVTRYHGPGADDRVTRSAAAALDGGRSPRAARSAAARKYRARRCGAAAGWSRDWRPYRIHPRRRCNSCGNETSSAEP